MSNPVLKSQLKNKELLYKSYIHWSKAGGLFIPTTQKFHLKDPVTVELTLLEEPTVFTIECIVIVLNPTSSQPGRWVSGIGAEFIGGVGINVKTKIEAALAGTLNSDKPTYTM